MQPCCNNQVECAMEKNNTTSEVNGNPRKRRKKNGTNSFKKKLNIFLLKVKSVFSGKKSRKKAAAKRSEEKVPLILSILIVVLNLLVMAVVVFFSVYLTLLWIDTYTNHNEEYLVPDVCGMSYDDALSVLESKKQTAHIIQYKHDDGASENEVLVQYPEPGSSVKEGRSIALVVNTTVKPRKTIPPIINNRSIQEAESHIKAAGFDIERIDTINGDKDWVYEVRYCGELLSNGDAIPEGSKITIVIGNGKEPVEEEEAIFDYSFDL